MSQTITFKCPCCGGYLEFNPQAQRFKCLYCGQVLSEDDLKEQSAQREAAADAAQEADNAARSKGEHSATDGSLRSYHCQMCGAEVVTSATTAATKCYYCHSPIVLHDRLDDEFRPDGVIPFKLDKAAAEKAFMEHVGKKKFIDRKFFSEAQLEMFSGVYHPYWFCDIEGEADFAGEGVRTSVSTTARHIVTTNRIFKVVRHGKLTFRDMARKALTEADGKLSDGIHPFDCSDVKPYASGYLSGFLAEKRNVNQSDAVAEMQKEAASHAAGMMKSDHTFNTLKGSTNFTVKKTDSRYVLLPTWVLTYKHDRNEETYYYMMNGQTGRVCGRLPLQKGKLWAFALGIGALVFAVLCMGGAMIW